MGATRDFVVATIADALAPSFRRPVEDIIYETLDRRQVPTRTDFKELRDLLNTLRGQLSGTSQGIQKLADGHAALAESVENTEEKIDARVDQYNFLQAKLNIALDKLQKLETQQQQFEKQLADQQQQIQSLQQGGANIDEAALIEKIVAVLQESPAAVVVKQPTTCKVPDCQDKRRARGFCARCYQKWKRGTLLGYVSASGKVKVKNHTITLSTEQAGEPYEIVDDKVVVQGVSY